MLTTIIQLVLSLTLAGPTPKADPPAEVFLLIGQSNMAGRAELIDQDTQPIPRVWLLNDHATWEPASQPLNRYASDHKGAKFQRFNLGGPFATALTNQDTNQTVGLIVNARGGTTIDQWLHGQDLYQHTLERIRAQDNIHLAGILWHQGESNRDDPDYGSKLKQLITALRNDLNQPDLPFIAGHISGENTINSQMDDLKDKLPTYAVVQADGLTLFDGIHYDRKSLITLGRRYAMAYQAMVSQTK